MKNNTSLPALDQGATGEAEKVVAKRAEGEEKPGEQADVSVAAMTEAEAAAMALSPAQQKAIVKLTLGGTKVEAAAAAGVNRTTVYRWMRQDPVFIAAYNTWKRDVKESAQMKLLSLWDTAVEAVGKRMRAGDGRLAMRFIEKSGMMERVEVGETEVEEVKRAAEVAARAAEVEKRRAEVAVAKGEGDLIMEEMMAGMEVGSTKRKRKG